jgi:hypothetical protein
MVLYYIIILIYNDMKHLLDFRLFEQEELSKYKLNKRWDKK